jgi:imidazolonepropionase-like amidohydrolase
MRPGKTLVMWLALLAAPLASAAQVLELTNLRLVDGTGAPARDVARRVVRDGLIVCIDSAGTLPAAEPGDRWTRLDLAGAWVMPGLVDTHVHVARFDDAYPQALKILEAGVRGGVTSVRDMGGDARTLAEIERARARGEITSPALESSALVGGADIFKDGPTAQMASGHPPGEAAWARRIDDTTDLALAVAEAKGSGVGQLKLYGDINPALARKIIAEAHRQGLRAAAHATVFPAGPGELVGAGIDSLAHAPYLVWEGVDAIPGDYRKRIDGPWATVPPDHPKLLALYRRMADKGVFLDATLFVYKSMNSYPGHPGAPWAAAAFAWAAKATNLARAAGVRVTAGTDWFEPGPGELPHTHEELALLVDAAGFTPMQAIVAGTRDGAAAMGQGDRRGTVEVGKAADLLVLDADPLEDIRNTQKIRLTVADGRIVEPGY